MAKYKGFSTFNRSKHFRITDFELVKQDLLNHFNIRKGEKLMDPNFGTVIWDTIFEPMDESTVDLVTNDVRKIIAYDPRIAARNVVVTVYDRGIQIDVDLIYISTNQSGILKLQFDRGSKTATQLL